MGAAHIVRNVSIPHPYCFAMRKKLLEDIGSFDDSLNGPHSIIDLGYRASQKGYRILYSPFEKFFNEKKMDDLDGFPEKDLIYFQHKWKKLLDKGDPNYNKWLTLKYNDMGLSI